jgi:hypothetical protein
MPAAAPGNAVLSVASGFAAQPGVANPLVGRTLVLLKDTFDSVLAKGGFPVPAGMVPFKDMGIACMNRTPDCQRAVETINAETVAGTRIDAGGKATPPASCRELTI